MNLVSAESLLVQMGLWVAAAIAIAVASSYFLRPKVRDRYPGGKGRYVTALTIQAAGFMIPIPFVLIYLLGAPIWPMFDVFLGVAAGVLVVLILRVLPVTGPLLRDLARTRLELALERMGGRP
ncbi:MAG: hypothetical protein NT015_05500 [Alphaproteobacteria bacterium]|nr:hypothetical protein [Alphaproteobacteria bacterium]